VPELAAGQPRVSDGGRTYAIRIRSGYRFSPPSNEPVTAETMRYTLERTLSPKLLGRGNGIPFLGDVVGASSFEAGKTAHVAGLVRRGDLLVIHLVKPVPDLPRRLATTGFCAVPLGTPALANGVPAALPSAGPYYVAATGGEATVVRRNPNYHGPRPHRVPTIVYTSDIDPARAIELIGRGKGDYVSEYNPALGSSSPAARAAGSRYRLVPATAASYLALNANRSLFRSPLWRRAVQLGFDRARFAGLDFSRPASDLLPPALAGHEPDEYSVRGDLRAARKLVGGRQVHAVLATFDPGYDRGSALHARMLRQELAALGIYTTIVKLTFNNHDDPRKLAPILARSDIVSWNADASYPDPVTYLQSLLYLTATDRAALARAATLPSPARENAAAAVARRLRARGTYVVYADGGLPVLVSHRVGCAVQQPEYPGLDLAAMCLKG
jgi:ABC-type transport system substrate-binding protein